MNKSLYNFGKTLLSHGSEAGRTVPSISYEILEEIRQLQSFGPQKE
jgi:hypothetical protein